MLTCAIGKFVNSRGLIRSSAMENQTGNKVYFHYKHTDSCRFARWNARECYQYMYSRPWQQVIDFYSDLVNQRLSLSGLFGTETHQFEDFYDAREVHEGTKLDNTLAKKRTGRWERVTFKIVLSYHGGSFDGWQKQPGLNTVQGLVERFLGRFVDDKKAQLLKDKSLPVEGCASVAGRTDKGVTALQQVCSFYTWRKDVKAQDVENSINDAAPGKLKIISASEVSRAFHPNFSAKWRHYFYIFPLNAKDEESNESEGDVFSSTPYEQYGQQRNGGTEYAGEDNEEYVAIDDEGAFGSGNKPRRFSISRVNQLLLQLEGKTLSYKMFARDTKASRSTGPPTECFIYHARATEARLPSSEEVNGEGTKVMCVELVANRFLRKMVRVLVATSIREAAAGAGDDALIKLMDATCRRATAPPAPPDGLCLVDVGYSDFDSRNCLIL